MTHLRRDLLLILTVAMLLFGLGLTDVKSKERSQGIFHLFFSELITDNYVFGKNTTQTTFYFASKITGNPGSNIQYHVLNNYRFPNLSDLSGFGKSDAITAIQIPTGGDQAQEGGGSHLGEKPSLLERFTKRYQEASFKVKLLIVILIYLILSLIILFIGIIINRQVKENKRKRVEAIKNEYQEQLASFLFDDESDRIEIKGINKKLNREILIDEIMELHNNLHGEAADKLKDLYFNLGLHQDSLKKVYKRRWDKKAKGFKELAQMDVKDANERIARFINHKNSILRMESQVAMVKLSEDDPLGFLAELKTELSHWEQVNIYETLIYHQINIDSFEQWLDSENPSVVVFSLRMIGLFKHIHSAPKVREYLFNENSLIALEAVKSLGEMELPEYVGDLKMLFESETLKLDSILKEQRKSQDSNEIKSLDDIMPRKIRFEIVKAINPIAASSDIDFLDKVLRDTRNTFKLRIIALETLLSVKPEGEQKLNRILDSEENELIKKMIINVKQNQES